MSAVTAASTYREDPGSTWVTALLGFNLWVMLVGAPALHSGAGGVLPIALEMSPLVVLVVALWRPAPLLLRFVYPASLLLPLLLSRPLMAERTLGPAGALAVIVSVVAWFLVAGGGTRRGSGPTQPARIAAVALGCLFVSGVYLVHFHPGLLGWIDGTWPGRSAEARVLLSLIAFMVWMVAAAVTLKFISSSSRVAPPSLLLLLPALLLLPVGCDEAGDSAGASGARRGPQARVAGAVVAVVDGTPITAATLQAAVRAEGEGADPRTVLDRLVTQEVLYERAEQAALAGDADVVNVRRQRAVQRLIEEEFESRTKASDVPERHLEAAFERNDRVFNHPNLMRVSHIVLLVDDDATDAHRAKAEALGATLYAQVTALPPEERTHAALKRLVKPHRGGEVELRAEDLGWKARTSRLVEEFLIAAFALTEDRQVSPVTKSSFGYHVILRRGWQDELVQTYEDVRAEVLDKLHPEWRQAEFMQWVEQLRDKANAQAWTEPLQVLQRAAHPAAALSPRGSGG